MNILCIIVLFGFSKQSGEEDFKPQISFINVVLPKNEDHAVLKQDGQIILLELSRFLDECKIYVIWKCSVCIIHICLYVMGMCVRERQKGHTERQIETEYVHTGTCMGHCTCGGQMTTSAVYLFSFWRWVLLFTTVYVRLNTPGASRIYPFPTSHLCAGVLRLSHVGLHSSGGSEIKPHWHGKCFTC